MHIECNGRACELNCILLRDDDAEMTKIYVEAIQRTGWMLLVELIYSKDALSVLYNMYLLPSLLTETMRTSRGQAA